MELLKNCVLCPRKCGINRYEKKGFCGANNKLKIAYYSLHMWEEPVISGTNGSGTIFFSNCNMKCLYCQNKKISTDGYGKYTSLKRLEEDKQLIRDFLTFMCELADANEISNPFSKEIVKVKENSKYNKKIESSKQTKSSAQNDKVPVWFNQEITKEEMSEDELKELEKQLSEFR